MFLAFNLMRSLSALMVSVALLMLSNSLFSTLLALRGKIEGYSNEFIGLTMSAYFIGFCIGTFRSGPLINRVGHIRSFAAFGAIASASTLCFVLVIHPWAWLITRLIMGASIAGMFVVAESWLNNRASNEVRGTVLAIYIMIGYLAAAIGQQVLPWSNPAEANLFLLVAIFLSLAVVPVALTRATHPDPVPSPRLDLRRLLFTSPAAVTGCFAAGLAIGALWGLAPIYARDIGLSVNQVAMFMSAALLGGLLFQLPIGRLSDHLDRRGVLLGTTLLGGLIAIGLALGPALPFPALLGAIFLYYGFTSTLYPLSLAYANDYLEHDDVITMGSGFVLAFSVGAALGPIAASLAMRWTGPSGLFLFEILVASSLTLFTLWRMRVRIWAGIIKKDPYVALPDVHAPVIVSELDPRANVSENYDTGADTLVTPHTPLTDVNVKTTSAALLKADGALSTNAPKEPSA